MYYASAAELLAEIAEIIDELDAEPADPCSGLLDQLLAPFARPSTELAAA